ncbi:hypothetical protein L218DRAFT_554917 [Marasmius fiardii PR-910]|nr:hypothetical protein L218DRAFT_554917 [Marasmius fiardii PR-910]
MRRGTSTQFNCPMEYRNWMQVKPFCFSTLKIAHFSRKVFSSHDYDASTSESWSFVFSYPRTVCHVLFQLISTHPVFQVMRSFRRAGAIWSGGARVSEQGRMAGSPGGE